MQLALSCCLMHVWRGDGGNFSWCPHDSMHAQQLYNAVCTCLIAFNKCYCYTYMHPCTNFQTLDAAAILGKLNSKLDIARVSLQRKPAGCSNWSDNCKAWAGCLAQRLRLISGLSTAHSWKFVGYQNIYFKLRHSFRLNRIICISFQAGRQWL